MMKYLWTILILLTMSATALAEDFVVSSDEYIVVSGNVSDTLGRTRLTPDSIRIVVTDSAGTELTDAWYESSDAQATLNGDVITFFDQWNDINGAASVGIFSLMVTIASDGQNNVDLFSNYNYTIRGVTVGLNATFDGIVNITDTVNAIIDTQQNQDNWVAREATLTGGIDVNVASMDAGAIESGDIAAGAIGATEIATDAIGAAEIAENAIGASEIAAGAIGVSEAPKLAILDTLIYLGQRGKGIWLDKGAANTNTVVGVDGTESNPVSTFAAGRTLADALGVKRYYIVNRSAFTGGSALGVTHEEWEFVGIGSSSGNKLELNSVDIDGSVIFHLTLTGTQGGSGDICVVGGEIGSYSGADGHFHGVGLTDTISIAATDDLFLDGCHSEVAGNGTPGIAFGAGVSNLSMRHYSGGIEIRLMDGNDKASIETDGQVIVNANCTSPNITVRGMATLTDNDGGTTWTKDAVFSRQESDQWIWDNDTTGHTAGGTQGYANTHGAVASISAGDIVAIADTIFHRDSSDVNDGAATSFGTLLMKAAYVQGSASLTKEEIADAVLDSMEVGTRSPSYVSVVVNNPSGDAVQFTSSGGNGDGLQITGVGSGNGLSAVGGTTGDGMFLRGLGVGSGLYVEATGTGDAVSFTATAGNGDGLSVTGSGSGDGIKATGGTSGGSGFRSTGFTTGHGFVGQGGATGHGFTGVGGANGHGMFLRGVGTGQGLRAEAIGTGVGLLATASGADAVQFTSSGGNGSGLQIQGDGSGDGITTTGGATGDGMNITGGSTSGAGLRVVADGTNDTGFVARGIGSGDGFTAIGGATGHGIYGLGGATSGSGIFGEAQTSGHGLRGLGAAGGAGLFAFGGTTGSGIMGTGGATSGHGIFANGLVSGNGIYALGGSTAGDGIKAEAATDGDGIDAIGATNGFGLKLTGAGSGKEITSTDLVDDIWSEDSAGYTAPEMAFLASQTGASGAVTDAAMGAIADSVWDKAATDARANAASVGKYILDSLQAILDSVQVGGGLDTLSDAYRDALLAIMNDTIELHHGTGDYGTGDGLDTLIYFAYDSVADAFIDGATINIKNTTTGSWVYTTNSAGWIIATLIDGATYYITANKSPGYIWPSIDTISSFSAATDSAYGYNTASTVIAPVVGKTAAVTVTVTRSDNTGYENVLVSAYLARSNVVDSAGRAIVNSIQRKRTDSNGRAQFTCMWSNYMIPATDWIFTVHKPASGGVSEAITIPTDSTTFNILFGTGQ